ncbi:tetratricopeptide repeat protein [Porphyrobacter algicida]|uniref:Tetratricopeptide repeat protein n=1 Tax=Qipengyuania algicida TaxID=1836209 RepID=A0A845AG94_9SPHN|nr:tetratricopeptide repeat protein [Qipengyuania algicida]MXP28664.1 tetratricopeptide repeat protein [Qipengyuania algicida]
MVAIISLTLLFTLGGCASSQQKAEKEAAIAQQLLNQGDVQGASRAIARALSYRDDQEDILLLDARIKYRLQDFRPAFDAYRVVLAMDPNNMEALSAISELGVAVGDKNTAEDAIKRALAINPDIPEVLLSKGVLELSDKDYDGAIATGEKILARNPQDPRGTVLKARGLFLQGKRAEALTMLSDAASKYGNNGLVSSALLEVARAQGDVPLMLEQFAFLSGQNPQSVDLALDEINVRYKSGDVTGARAVGLSMLERFGNDSQAMGRLVDMWDEYDVTPLTDQDIAAVASKDGMDARLAVARFYIDHAKSDVAAKLVAGSSDPRASGLLARIGIEQGNPQAAAAARKIIEQDTTNCEALTGLAEWDLMHGKPNDAITQAQVVATDCLDRIDGYVLLAKAYQKANRPAGVERVYREGIEAHPQDPNLTKSFADWLVSRGNIDAAESAVRRLSNVAPSRESSWDIYLEICQKAKDSACTADARQGLLQSKTAYALDPLPGIRRANPLVGRTWQ